MKVLIVYISALILSVILGFAVMPLFELAVGFERVCIILSIVAITTSCFLIWLKLAMEDKNE